MAAAAAAVTAAEVTAAEVTAAAAVALSDGGTISAAVTRRG